ncbi:hypothetical protein ACFV6E_37925 [Streptomyces sp. NPDC059785]|uniref:hypothetical protein n=1 Tax=unclassified Streptomyces TaxID=2593676 RepID=UPI003668182E
MTRLLQLGRLRGSAASEEAAEPELSDSETPDAEVSEESGSEGSDSDESGPEESEASAESEEGPEAAGRQEGRRASLWRRIVPAATAAVLVLAGCAFFYGAHQLRNTPSAGNHALTDAEATTRVAGDVSNALARVFSYTPDGLAATERSADSVLDGRAARQYAELMDRVRADLKKQRVTLSTQAVRTGVIELDGDSARLLVFLDQVSDRGKDGTTSAAAQLTVTARWEKDQWRIVDIRTR